MRNWKKKAIVFTLATGLLLSAATLSTINTASANTQKQAAQSTNVKHQVILKQTKNLADDGKTINSEKFGVGSSTKDIIKKWGQPDNPKEEISLKYSKRQIEFLARSKKVTTVVSNDNRYEGITYQEVVDTLGLPYEYEDGKDIIISYEAEKHTLKIAFNRSGKDQSPSTIKYLFVK
ncbi:DUF4309 domain-containing protein [Shimazuella kribbensis]|uniref:DUF4309 domain-containing protein n=1 Tax=Shimazuella kribbensis TaxID=139808 RepID=UPI000405C1B1|nr:DUF4309 domain-containing protein [Shimazuella kribbensis]